MSFPCLSSDPGPQSLCSSSFGQPFFSHEQHCNRPQRSYMYRQKEWLQSPQPLTITHTIIKPPPIFGPKLKKLHIADVANLFPHSQDIELICYKMPCLPIVAIQMKMECLATDEVLCLKNEQ